MLYLKPKDANFIVSFITLGIPNKSNVGADAYNLYLPLASPLSIGDMLTKLQVHQKTFPLQI